MCIVHIMSTNLSRLDRSKYVGKGCKLALIIIHLISVTTTWPFFSLNYLLIILNKYSWHHNYERYKISMKTFNLEIYCFTSIWKVPMGIRRNFLVCVKFLSNLIYIFWPTTINQAIICRILFLFRAMLTP